MRIRVHGVLASSRVNGPGRRAVVHLQGCTLGCPGCFNPEAHDPGGGRDRDVDELAAELLAGEPDGVSVSGGEPLQQAEALLVLLRALRGGGARSILVFSGHTLEEIRGMALGPPVLELVDVLVAGRYDATQSTVDPLLASANQRLHLLTDRHEAPDLLGDGTNVELTIAPDGSVTLTGFPSPALRIAVRRLAGDELPPRQDGAG